MAQKPIPETDAQKARRRKVSNEFDIARAKAINTYADLERMLGLLFEHLLGVRGRRAFIVFSAMLNNRARLRTIGKLMNLSYGDKYDAFWASLVKGLGSIDERRNKIVHWITLHSSTGGRSFQPNDIALHEHPDMYGQQKIYKKDIDEFVRRADFYRLLVFYFETHLKFPDVPDDPSKTPWRDIFSQRITYPPASTHPLYPLRA